MLKEQSLDKKGKALPFFEDPKYLLTNVIEKAKAEPKISLAHHGKNQVKTMFHHKVAEEKLEPANEVEGALFASIC